MYEIHENATTWICTECSHTITLIGAEQLPDECPVCGGTTESEETESSCGEMYG